MKIYKDYIRYDLVCLVEYVSSIVFLLPRLRIFNFFKSLYLRLLFKSSIGKRVVFYPGVWIFTGKNLHLGDDVDLARSVLITTDGGVSIGARTLIGYGTMIFSSNHKVPENKLEIFDSGHEKKFVEIKNDVWIGAGCIILPGVTIGEGSVVAAGSVVTKNLPDFVYAAGVPARVIKERK